MTRVEIAREIQEAFQGSSATKEQILAAAHRANARSEVVAALERLPLRNYAHLRDPWTELHHIPVGA